MSAPTNEDDRRGEFTVSRVVDAPDATCLVYRIKKEV